MSSVASGQDLSANFFYDGKPCYKRVSQWHRSFIDVLPSSLWHIVGFIIDCSVQYGDMDAYISTKQFETGREGTMPLPPMSQKTLFKNLALGQKLGLFTKQDRKYTVNLNLMPLDLADSEEAWNSFKDKHSRNPKLCSLEGMKAWLITLTHSLIGAPKAEAEPEQEQSEERDIWKAPDNKGFLGYSPYRVIGNIYQLFRDKSLHSLVGEFLMGKLSASDLKQSLLASVEEKRSKVWDKRKKRRTLADEVKLFDRAWKSAQTDKGGFAVGITLARDAAILKNKVLIPMRDTDMDPVKLAEWVAGNWEAIGASYFTKSKRYPEMPAFRWFVACLDQYIEAYANKDALDTTKSFSKAAKDKQIHNADATIKALREKLAVAQAEASVAKNALKETRPDYEEFSDEPLWRKGRFKKVKPGKFE